MLNTNLVERHGLELYKETKPYRVSVPCGKSGRWEVRKFKTEAGLAYVRFLYDGRAPGIGGFTSLVRDGRTVVMSDTVAEINDFRAYAYELRGRVLISGLGLGMAVHILTKCEEYSKHVTSITVLEKDPDVVALVARRYRDSDSRVTIINADAYEWEIPKDAKFDAAWHDIWDTITTDNVPGMTKLRRKYQRCVTAGKQFCWGQAEIKRMQREDRNRW